MAGALGAWAALSHPSSPERDRWQCELLAAEDPRRRTCGLDHATRGTLPHRIECGNLTFPCNVDHANAYRARFLAGAMPCCPTPPHCHSPACAGVITQGLAANAKAWSNMPLSFIASSSIMMNHALSPKVQDTHLMMLGQPSAKTLAGSVAADSDTTLAPEAPEINQLARHLFAPEAPEPPTIGHEAAALHTIPANVAMRRAHSVPKNEPMPVFLNPLNLKAAMLLEPGYLVGARKREQLEKEAAERELELSLMRTHGEQHRTGSHDHDRGPVRKFQQAFIDFMGRLLGISRNQSRPTATDPAKRVPPRAELRAGTQPDRDSSHADPTVVLHTTAEGEASRPGKGVRPDGSLQPEALHASLRVPDNQKLTLTALPKDRPRTSSSSVTRFTPGSDEHHCSQTDAVDNFAFLTRQDVWPAYHGFGGSFEADLQKYTDLLGCKDNSTGACPYHAFDVFLDVGASTGEATESILKRHVARDFILVEANSDLVQRRLQPRWGSPDFVGQFLDAYASNGAAVRRRPDSPRPRFDVVEAAASRAAGHEIDMCVIEPAFGQGPRGQAGCLSNTTTVDAVLQSKLSPSFRSVYETAQSMLVRVSTEGMDGLVLQGMRDLLQARRGQYADGRPRYLVNVLQFEYNPALMRLVRGREGLALSEYSLRNVTKLLEQQGFETFLVGPRYLPLSHGAWDDRFEEFTGDARNNDGIRKSYPGFHSLICAWCESLGERNVTSMTSDVLAIRADSPRASYLKRGLGACAESRDFDPADSQYEHWGEIAQAPAGVQAAETPQASVIRAGSYKRGSTQRLPDTESSSSHAHVLVAADGTSSDASPEAQQRRRPRLRWDSSFALPY